MLKFNKYVKCRGICTTCDIELKTVQEIKKHEELHNLHHVKIYENFDISFYINDLMKICKSDITKLK